MGDHKWWWCGAGAYSDGRFQADVVTHHLVRSAVNPYEPLLPCTVATGALRLTLATCPISPRLIRPLY